MPRTHLNARTNLRHLAAWAGACAALGLFFSTQLYLIMAQTSDRAITWGLAIRWELFTWFLWGLLVFPVVALARRFPLERGRWGVSVPVHAAGSAAVAAAHLAVAASWFTAVEAPKATAAVWWSTFRFQFVIDFHWNVFIYGAILAGVHAVRFHRRVREGEARAAQLRAHVARARLDALQMQLRPHFLFNTLNSIAALVPDDPRGAERMIVNLSDLLRITLDRRDTHKITLDDELVFVRRYLDIEQVRFGDRLTVRFRIEPAAGPLYVPALILQPLVENAVRHGVAPRTGACTVDIAAARAAGALVLEVADDGPGPGTRPEPGPGAGIGLENTRARLAHLYGDAARIELVARTGGGCVARVRLPVQTGPGPADASPGEPAP